MICGIVSSDTLSFSIDYNDSNGVGILFHVAPTGLVSVIAFRRIHDAGIVGSGVTTNCTGTNTITCASVIQYSVVIAS